MKAPLLIASIKYFRLRKIFQLHSGAGRGDGEVGGHGYKQLYRITGWTILVKVLFRGVCFGKIFPPDHCIGSAVLRWCWCGGGPSAFTTALHRSGQLQQQTYMKLHNTTNNTTINHVFTLAPPSNIGWRCKHQPSGRSSSSMVATR